MNQLRMAIEMRLRRGFGISAKLDRKGAIVPLALSDVIEAIRDHKADIDLAVPLEHIERLYGWANIYMHSGLKQYTWSPIFALSYLRPLLLGGKHSSGTSVYAGIVAAYGVIKQVQSGVERRMNKAHYSLVVEDPRQCDVILRARHRPR